ncbi:cytochrome b-c1 complex subunit 6, mitochondrial [Coccinella septempunctata]|uniref:cytochrome b-c1 complex subunit 6, mitochondrial n=1 Tax=Coccinella septempunctata TaxID=41139 RepID=UPI001D05C71C|nr:cytochrome b-c1 complex subunit 6, mitochondrial [Coccinella septempunctata]XP_044763800.1 cytochrome b-c1 complex subunit 6, mitochondrial [Coccinella septempunctata]
MVFENFFSRFTKSLTVKAQEEAEEEDVVDPQEVLRAECRETEHCKHLADILQQCTDRVNSKTHTTETCAEELFDLLHAIDHCVTPKLFGQLK